MKKDKKVKVEVNITKKQKEFIESLNLKQKKLFDVYISNGLKVQIALTKLQDNVLKELFKAKTIKDQTEIVLCVQELDSFLMELLGKSEQIESRPHLLNNNF